ncbi:Lysophospholipase, alpha-beta hydrolase superfamily [Pseudovibrio denitrificans]|uniref:Lysophospholipase, alpha-beta hydrolase superfamily n=1 Tax=Pseudovibrio denitrificans TaxID=258256 RepID=A0A1I6X922_9HYPH|nr:alpha/beta fold hydrolase [Pseudovibrio denitrificans]SFT34807.1 Lysophospholipase, alpha-beta hydrolase superfamily [Pseudovibrio denitrificans]
MLSPFKISRLAKEGGEQDYLRTTNALADTPVQVISREETAKFQQLTVVEDGIERIRYIPHQPKHKTPLIFIHGMWHGAWCWKNYQEKLAETGWESVAISLPGHGHSPEQRPIAEATLGYYLRFIADEVQRHERPPVLIGHSMGGALVQWYLKYVGGLKAAVFVASWTAIDVLQDCLKNAMTIDLLGTALSPFLGYKFQFRSPKVAAKWFLAEQTNPVAQYIQSQLGPESEVVLMQHRPPQWFPPLDDETPKLWLTASEDAIVPFNRSLHSAALYEATHKIVPHAGHDLMLEDNWEESLSYITTWLQNMSTTKALATG